MKRAAILFLLVLSVTVLGQQAQKSVRFFKPNYGWAVEVPFQDFAIASASAPDQDSFRVEAVNEKKGIILDVYFEKGAPDADCKLVRNYYESLMRQSSTKMEGASRWEAPPLSFLIYNAKDVMKEPKGDELNGDVYFSKGMTWVDVRFRIPYSKAGDEKSLQSILQSVKLIGGFEATVEDNIFMGGLFCQSGFGDNCVSCLRQAYDREKRTPRLARNPRIALCQNLADALRMKGEREKAMEVLDYGLSLDKNYPMYFWMKARIYGDLGDEDGAVEMLKLAVENAQNLLPGEKFPDPRQDESFKVLGMKETFRERITAIFNPKEPKPEEKKTEK